MQMTAGARVENHQGVFLNMLYIQHVSLAILGPAQPVTQRTDWVTSGQRLVLTAGMDYDTERQQPRQEEATFQLAPTKLQQAPAKPPLR